MKKIKISSYGSDLIDLDNLQPFQGKLKKIKKEDLEKLKKQIIKYGFSDPISVWDNEGNTYILDGHQRVKALLSLKDDGYNIPLIPINNTEANDYKEAKEKVLSLSSRYGKITKKGMIDFSQDVEFDVGLSVDLGLGSFIDVSFLEDDSIVNLETEIAVLSLTKEVDNEFPLFDSDNELGLPVLKPDMMFSGELPDNISIAPKTKEYDLGKVYLTPEPFKSITDPINNNSILCYYVDDYRFFKLYDKPLQNCNKIIQRGNIAVVMPNYSIWRDDPKILQMYARYKSNWVARYLQEKGVQIIYDINFGDASSYDWAFLGCPKKLKYAFCQARNHKTKQELKALYDGLKAFTSKVEVEKIYIYGTMKLIPVIKKLGINFQLIQAR